LYSGKAGRPHRPNQDPLDPPPSDSATCSSGSAPNPEPDFAHGPHGSHDHPASHEHGNRRHRGPDGTVRRPSVLSSLLWQHCKGGGTHADAPSDHSGVSGSFPTDSSTPAPLSRLHSMASVSFADDYVPAALEAPGTGRLPLDAASVGTHGDDRVAWAQHDRASLGQAMESEGPMWQPRDRAAVSGLLRDQGTADGSGSLPREESGALQARSVSPVSSTGSQRAATRAPKVSLAASHSWMRGQTLAAVESPAMLDVASLPEGDESPNDPSIPGDKPLEGQVENGADNPLADSWRFARRYPARSMGAAEPQLESGRGLGRTLTDYTSRAAGEEPSKVPTGDTGRRSMRLSKVDKGSKKEGRHELGGGLRLDRSSSYGTSLSRSQSAIMPGNSPTDCTDPGSSGST
jgi:hypothetical protein